jgi:hypothetical protein
MLSHHPSRWLGILRGSTPDEPVGAKQT